MKLNHRRLESVNSSNTTEGSNSSLYLLKKFKDLRQIIVNLDLYQSIFVKRLSIIFLKLCIGLLPVSKVPLIKKEGVVPIVNSF